MATTACLYRFLFVKSCSSGPPLTTSDERIPLYAILSPYCVTLVLLSPALMIHSLHIILISGYVDNIVSWLSGL